MSVFSYFKRLIAKKVKVPIPYSVNQEKLLEGRVALITGGGSGIGYSIAELFLQHGARVIIAGRSEKKLKEACEKLKLISSSITYICMDVSSVPDIEDKFTKLCREGFAIDILVNSAGIHHTESFGKISELEYTSIMDINVKGTYFLTQVVSNQMITRGIHGNILNVSSSSGVRPAWGPYQLSKWAINGMTKGFADRLLKYGIVVNAVAPGQTATPMLNTDLNNIDNESAMLGRFIVPSEIANIAVFLVSDFGRVIVGDTIYASGGSGIVNSHL